MMLFSMAGCTVMWVGMTIASSQFAAVGSMPFTCLIEANDHEE
jgi:hypothetical protein